MYQSNLNLFYNDNWIQLFVLIKICLPVCFSFHCVGISVLLLHNISEFIKHAFKLIDNVKGEIKRAQRESL